MRSEDLSGIPESIEAWRVGELLEGLGFKPGSYVSVFEILIEPRSIKVKAYATNEEGKRYVVEGDEIEVTDLGEKDPSYVTGPAQPAVHTISIPFVGGWEKPEERCDSRGRDGIRCQHDAGHDGRHQLGSVYWASKSDEPLHSYVFPCPREPKCGEPTKHHHYRDESGVAWVHLTVPKEQEHTECDLPECPGPASVWAPIKPNVG